MQPNNFVDNQTPLGYNNTHNDENELAAIAGLDQHTHVVNMDKQKPIHDTECKHETLVPNPQDTIGDAVYHGCANEKCGRGWYIRQN